MTEKEFDEMIDELIELCFEVENGEYYCDRCLEFDSVVKLLDKRIKRH